MYKNRKKRMIFALISMFFTIGAVLLGFSQPVSGQINDVSSPTIQLDLTEKELAYVKEHPVVRAMVTNGIAPLEYMDPKGNPQGITIQLMKIISERTGLEFQFSYAGDTSQALEAASQNRVDMIDCIPIQYAGQRFPGYPVSRPYISCKTLLYVKDSFEEKSLDGKIYAAVSGSDLPDGMKEENVRYYPTKEKSLLAVSRGDADYGYGNEFSVTYYIMRNGLRNISVIPSGKDGRRFCFIFVNQDETFMGIMNKAIASLTPEDLQSIILQGTTQIKEHITLFDVLAHYGRQIAALGVAVILLLIFIILLLYSTSLKLKMQNDRLLQLEDLSDEYIYEYSIQEDRLHLSGKCLELFRSIPSLKKAKWTPIEGDVILKEQPPEVNAYLRDLLFPTEGFQEKNIQFSDKASSFFKVVNSTVRTKNNMPLYIIGKLMDIGRDREEKEILLEIARLDMMTQLLNSQCCKANICEAFWNLQEGTTGFLYLMDIDCFKQINDAHGHAAGDQVIVAVARALEQCFGGSDILGRVGGDEFCAYTSSLHSEIEAQQKYDKLLSLLEADSLTKEYHVTVSMGIIPVSKGQTFEAAYRLADQALYEVKRSGKGRCLYLD